MRGRFRCCVADRLHAGFHHAFLQFGDVEIQRCNALANGDVLLLRAQNPRNWLRVSTSSDTTVIKSSSSPPRDADGLITGSARFGISPWREPQQGFGASALAVVSQQQGQLERQLLVLLPLAAILVRRAFVGQIGGEIGGNFLRIRQPRMRQRQEQQANFHSRVLPPAVPAGCRKQSAMRCLIDESSPSGSAPVVSMPSDNNLDRVQRFMNEADRQSLTISSLSRNLPRMFSPEWATFFGRRPRPRNPHVPLMVA